MNQRVNQLPFVQAIAETFQTEGVQGIYKKNTLLTREGDIETNLYLIEEGAVKVYYQSELDEHIVRLGYNGSMLNSLSSFISEKPSELSIKTLRETRVKILRKKDVMGLMDDRLGYSKFLETMLVQQLDRELDLLQDSPAQRLERVIQRSPKLFQHVPLKYIASYLRMTPETLSRIRNS